MVLTSAQDRRHEIAHPKEETIPRAAEWVKEVKGTQRASRTPLPELICSSRRLSTSENKWVVGNQYVSFIRAMGGEQTSQQQAGHNMRKNDFQVLKQEEDEECLCSSVSGHEELWLKEGDGRRRDSIEKWEATCGRSEEPNTKEPIIEEDNAYVTKCETCTVGSSNRAQGSGGASGATTRQGCGHVVAKPFRVARGNAIRFDPKGLRSDAFVTWYRV